MSDFISESCEIDNSSQIHNIPNSLDIVAKENKKPQIKIEKKTNLPKNAPQFLMKFSASYFQVADLKKNGLFGLFVRGKKAKKQNSKQKKIEENKAKIGDFAEKELSELQNKNSNRNNDQKNNPKEFKKKTANNPSNLSSMSNISEKSLKNCVICYDKIPDAVIMECGHGGYENFNKIF